MQQLYRLSQMVHAATDPPRALNRLIREVVRLLNASSGSIVLVNPTDGFLDIQTSCGLPPEMAGLKLRIGEGITGWVARTGQPALVGQVRQDSRCVMLRPEIQSELAVPIEIQGGVRGVLNVDADRENAFSDQDMALLEELACHAGRVILNAWRFEQLRLKTRLFESLLRVGQTINSTLNLDDALEAITREARGLMQARVCSILMLDPSREWLDLRASHGAGPGYCGKPRLSVADSLLGVVVRRRKPLQVENVRISSRYQNIEVARQEGLVSLLSVPLVFRGRAIGTLNVYTAQPHRFSNEEVHILSALAELSALAIEKARLYERIVDLEEQLRQNEKLSALGLLAAEVAHEIRNPLTVLKMLFHSLDLRFPSSDPRARDIELMAEKMDQLNRIVERMLDFARRAEPRFESVDLNRLVDDLGMLVRHKLIQSGIRWSCRLEPGLPAVLGDAMQIEHALLNLTLNAAEAMPGGGALTITTRTQPRRTSDPRPREVMIEFRDTGQGMTLEQQQQAFRSVLATTKPRGTGLGLAIVNRVIEAHHGRICVRSRPGRGAVFRLYLPVAP